MLKHRRKFKNPEVITDGFDQTFAAASRFCYLEGSQRSAVNHTVSRIITSWEGASRGAMIFFVASSTSVDKEVKGLRQQDGFGFVRADGSAEIIPSHCTY